MKIDNDEPRIARSRRQRKTEKVPTPIEQPTPVMSRAFRRRRLRDQAEREQRLAALAALTAEQTPT